ncbi:MAG TPA: peptide MFS transporter [Bryobacteraceae bacterium]|jgi:POT family proton-dependent oligopeptide transporter|nr:peptide MFS transporter [Bryobacteraceae bacterium]
MSADPLALANDRTFFGHPRGLSTLFFTEMWERFSYYGIRALLILYMTAAVDRHGMGMSVALAGVIYGLYTSCAYVFALPAGWMADRFLGHQRSVILGGLLIAAGNFGLMLPAMGTFVGSLLLMAIGTGFLKTSCTTLVGFLYGQHDNRRDSGFTLYYVGINIGAGLAPLICGYVGQTIDYRYAFGLAGLFMLAGLIQFQVTRGYLGAAGREPAKATPADRRILSIGSAALAVALAVLFLMRVALDKVADGFAALLLIAVVVTFGGLILSKDFTTVEKKRIYVILVLFVASALFWSIFEQAGSTLNLFADRSTDNHFFGFAFPSSWYQSLNSGFIYVLGPVLAWLWIRMGDRDPSLVTKFAIGLLGAGAGFVVMVFAAHAAGDGGRVSPLWLTGVYLIHTVGELCLSPVGLSAITKLAPARIAGLTMGVWFLSISVGNFFAGRMASFYESMPLDRLVGYAGGLGIAVGLVLLLISRPVTRLMGGVK